MALSMNSKTTIPCTEMYGTSTVQYILLFVVSHQSLVVTGTFHLECKTIPEYLELFCNIPLENISKEKELQDTVNVVFCCFG